MRAIQMVAVVALGGLFSMTVAAVDLAASDATPPNANAGAGLEEIVVTATRHEESLSKVPISITALSQDTMDVQGIRDFTDIARFTPGVAIDRTGSNSITIRGIGASGGAGTTGIYIDDTPIQIRALGLNPPTRCRRPSIWSGWRCCAVPRARYSVQAPRAAPCATS
jgi:iron complex outermembrane receptor protein